MIKYELTEKIIGCAYEVHNTLGFGFLEKVYEIGYKNKWIPTNKSLLITENQIRTIEFIPVE